MYSNFDAPVYLVINNSGDVYTETPEEQGVVDKDLGLMRVFETKVEAERYRDAVDVFAEERLETVIAPLEAVMVQANSKKAKVELCYMPEDEWPKSLDIIYDPSATLH